MDQYLFRDLCWIWCGSLRWNPEFCALSVMTVQGCGGLKGSGKSTTRRSLDAKKIFVASTMKYRSERQAGNFAI